MSGEGWCEGRRERHVEKDGVRGGGGGEWRSVVRVAVVSGGDGVRGDGGGEWWRMV